MKFENKLFILSRDFYTDVNYVINKSNLLEILIYIFMFILMFIIDIITLPFQFLACIKLKNDT